MLEDARQQSKANTGAIEQLRIERKNAKHRQRQSALRTRVAAPAQSFDTEYRQQMLHAVEERYLIHLILILTFLG
jgi:hypothetical protein